MGKGHLILLCDCPELPNAKPAVAFLILPGFGVGGLVELLLARRRRRRRARASSSAVELDLLFVAFVDLGDADDMLLSATLKIVTPWVLRPAMRMSPTVVRMILPWSVTSISDSPGLTPGSWR